MRITDVRIFRLDLELPTPFRTSTSVHRRSDNVLVIIDTDEGIVGYGECMASASDLYSQIEVLRILRKIKLSLFGQDPRDIEGIHELLSAAEMKMGESFREAKASIDFACYDILGKSLGKPVYEVLGVSEPRIVFTSMTIGLDTPRKMMEMTRKYMERFKLNGLRRIKLKIEGEPKVDLKRVLLVADVFPGELTLDVNEGFKDPKVAVKLFNELHKELGDKILLIEEPCPRGDLKRTKYVTANSKIPIFADQSAASFEKAREIIEQEAANGINIKLDRAGGIYWGIKIAEIAEKSHMNLMVTGTFSCGIHHTAAAHFAAAIKNVINADIDTDITFNLYQHLLEEFAEFKNGSRIPPNKPGLGVRLKSWIKALLDEEIIIERYS